MNRDPLSFTAFWNSLNELSSPGNGMVIRHHAHETEGEGDYDWNGMALYSADMLYRYALVRVWDRTRPMFGVIMLNPSTATEEVLDPTVMRVLERARREGSYGGLVVLNIFAFRATEPNDMKIQTNPIGRENNKVIDALVPHCARLLCGWGTHGTFGERGKHVRARLEQLGAQPYMLDMTKCNQPIHPLYQAYSKEMKPWR